jgi:hypothetical protein
MKNSTKVLLGFAAGVAAGAGLYYLSQTEKGKEIVNDINRRAEGLKKGMGDIVDKGKHMAEDLAKKFNGAPKEPAV